MRNDQLIIEKSEEATEAKPAPEKYGFLRKLAMGPLGVLLWSALIAFELQFLYKKVFLMGGEGKAKSE
jgi:hypothetical protein